MDFDQAAQTIGRQFMTAWNAPVPFLAAMAAGWFVLRWYLKGQYETRISNAESTIALRNAQLQDYKDKLSGATPDEAKARMDALESRLDHMGPQIAALAPRRVGPEQRQMIVTALDAFRGCAIVIAADGASPDASQLSKGLTAAFNSAAWHVQSAMVMGIANPPPSGVGFLVENPSHLTPQQNSVVEALRAAGLDFDLQASAPQQHHELLGKPSPIGEILLTTRLHD